MEDSVLIRKNAGQRKPIIWHVLRRVLRVIHWNELNNFILSWYCTIANKNQLLITINMVKIYHLEADTKAIQYQWGSHTHPRAYQIDIKIGSCIHRVNKTFSLYAIHRHKIHEQPIFPWSFISVFNLTIDSLYLIDWGKLFQSRHALNNTRFMP